MPSKDGLSQIPHIAGMITGSRDDEGVHSKSKQVDFYDIKGILESILNLSGRVNHRFEITSNPVLHPGQGADLYLGNKLTGFLGALHPSIISQLQLNQQVFVF